MRFWLDNKRPHVECTEEELRKAWSNRVEFYKLQCKISFRVFLLVPNRNNWNSYKVFRRCLRRARKEMIKCRIWDIFNQ